MRADVYLVEKGYYKSRNKASEAIQRGEVFIDGKELFKASKEIDNNVKIEIKEDLKPFVSLGGYKLKTSIDILKPDIKDKIFIDAGASTGGFTDCLLREGAKKVYAVDVGENLLDESISKNNKVVVMDKTNVRFLSKDKFKDEIDGIVVDCSFISLEYVLPTLSSLLSENGYILALIKPQFELNERVSLKNGILKDDKIRKNILKKLYDFSLTLNLIPTSIVDVTQDKKKNTEFIFYIKKQGNTVDFKDIII